MLRGNPLYKCSEPRSFRERSSVIAPACPSPAALHGSPVDSDQLREGHISLSPREVPKGSGFRPPPFSPRRCSLESGYEICPSSGRLPVVVIQVILVVDHASKFNWTAAERQGKSRRSLREGGRASAVQSLLTVKEGAVDAM